VLYAKTEKRFSICLKIKIICDARDLRTFWEIYEDYLIEIYKMTIQSRLTFLFSFFFLYYVDILYRLIFLIYYIIYINYIDII